MMLSVVTFLTLAAIVTAINADSVCKSDSCSPRQRCFPYNNTDGFLCCTWRADRRQYIYQESSEKIINCSPLSCYVCTSKQKGVGDGCGRTFGYTHDEAVSRGISVKCDDIGVPNARACGKMITNAYFNNEIVTRMCVNTSNPLKNFYPHGCNEYNQLETCYCNTDNCNSQIRHTLSISGIIFTLFSSLILL